ncbi:MAG TPA: S53 family peptidase [Pseudonocardiaceae bacterium]|nr:S53 family peptidase [Pseudonocardiaceae bacterium]
MLTVLLAAVIAPATAAAAPAAATTESVGQQARVEDLPNQPVPIPTSQCLAKYGTECYTPAQLRDAYDLNPLYRYGITGAGRTIVLVDPYGSPTIQHDLNVFDKQFGLPDTTVQVFAWGKIPPFDPTDDDMVGSAEESTLDVEVAHAIAPGAKIVLAETAVDQTEGLVGMPELMGAINALVDAHDGDVMSMSWGTREEYFPGYAQGDYSSLESLRYAFKNAVAHVVTLTASSGDGGGFPNVGGFWPSSDPLVTAVGGTHIDLADNGSRTKPDSAWLDSGGYRSTVFGRPAFQNPVRSVAGTQRVTPDVSLDADPNGGMWVYSSFPPANQTGWWLGGGTSQSAPMFAAIVALADQAARHRFGQIDNELYQLYAQHAKGIVDVTVGDTADPSEGSTGFPATPGYDQATGVGTIDAAKFVADLLLRHP